MNRRQAELATLSQKVGNSVTQTEYIINLHSIDSRYLEFQRTLWNTSRYPYLDISDLQNLGKNKSNNHI